MRYRPGFVFCLLFVATLLSAGYPPANLELEKGEFLVATEKLRDSAFKETVVLLAHYDKNGSFGLVINDPTKVPLSEGFPQIPSLKRVQQQIYLGGPMERSKVFLLIRSTDEPQDSMRLFDHVYFSISQKVLEKRAPISGARESLRVFAGYSGWGAGQLEMEIKMGAWAVWKADDEIIFDRPAKEVWPEMIRRVSIIQAFNGFQNRVRSGK
jgi:putative transcriptional regulator